MKTKLELQWGRITDSEFQEVSNLNDICSEYKDLAYIRSKEPELGEIYGLYSHEKKVILGYAVYAQLPYDNWNNNAYIWRIGTHPLYRRQGIADYMLNAIFKDLKSRQIKSEYICCDIRQSNTASMSLFRKHGFKLCNISDEIYEDGELGHRMCASLKE